MIIREKHGAVRITLADTSRGQNIPYVAIEPKTCWSSTFNGWGKKADAPIIHVGGKRFRVVLEEITG